jgi:hypothetical protein
LVEVPLWRVGRGRNGEIDVSALEHGSEKLPTIDAHAFHARTVDERRIQPGDSLPDDEVSLRHKASL